MENVQKSLIPNVVSKIIQNAKCLLNETTYHVERSIKNEIGKCSIIGYAYKVFKEKGCKYGVTLLVSCYEIIVKTILVFCGKI